jgi:hypothetical protein
MIKIATTQYNQVDKILRSANSPVTEVYADDHLNGFDYNYDNLVLGHIQEFAAQQQQKIKVHVSYVCNNDIIEKFDWLDFKTVVFWGWKSFSNYNIHPKIEFKKFLCSFNGSAHVSRKLLTAILHRFGWFDPETCSKNFTCTNDVIYGHIEDYSGERGDFYSKFFVSANSENFLQTDCGFGWNRFDHAKNIYCLEDKLARSFLHIVSETMATSHYPLVSEKFLYSVVTRGLFLSYAQPNWHNHLERYFGFRKYDKIFDYNFDNVDNPVERLIKLMSMIAKFSVLSSDDWRDLYEMESDTIEYNYDHYFSGRYLETLQRNE